MLLASNNGRMRKRTTTFAVFVAVSCASCAYTTQPWFAECADLQEVDCARSTEFNLQECEFINGECTEPAEAELGNCIISMVHNFSLLSLNTW